MRTHVSWKRVAVLTVGALIVPGGFLAMLAALLLSGGAPGWLVPPAPREN